MKKFLLMLTAATMCSLSLSAQCKIVVKLDGLRSKQGKVYVALHDSAESFSAKGRYYKGNMVDISKSNECVFENLPEGRYTVVIFHDENNDKRLNTNAIGVPKEGYGFSNNVFGPMNSKPTFMAASFVVGKNKKEVVQTIKFKYLK